MNYTGLCASALALAGLFFCSPLAAEPTPPLPVTTPAAAGFSTAGLERLQRNLARTVDDGSHAGYILLLARDGKVVDWHAYGIADITTGRPLNRDAIVRIFSMSKLFTSAATLMLVEEGKLRLSDPVEQFLPALGKLQVCTGGTAEAPVLEPVRTPITIRHLLTHTAGFYYPFNAPPALAPRFNHSALRNAPDLTTYISQLAQYPLAEQPGTVYRYGIATDVLGAVIEKVSGQSLDTFFQKRICEPLGLVDTAFWVPPEKRHRLARIHTRGADGRLVLDTAENNDDRWGPNHGLREGGAGLYSTAADYARFAQMLLNGGTLDGVRVLGRKTVELFRQDHISHLSDPHPVGDRASGFGLGVRVTTRLGASHTLDSVGAFGWTGYATTTVQIDPQERTVALLLYQHLPYNEGDVFSLFTNGWYSALEN
jgi:CubicO group peptidase (beta-lactamase class C family)